MLTTATSPSRVINLSVQALTITGAINWGLIGIADIDLVKLLFKQTILTQAIYIAVGVAGIVQLVQLIMKIQQRA